MSTDIKNEMKMKCEKNLEESSHLLYTSRNMRRSKANVPLLQQNIIDICQKKKYHITIRGDTMARPKKCRRVCQEPSFESFIPGGIPADGIVQLSVDEYETIRLIDYEKMTQEECALQMEVARTTITDIYMQARYKIADSLIHGKRLEIAGGNYSVCDNRTQCQKFGQCKFRQKNCKKIQLNNKENDIMRIAVTYEDGEIFQHFGHTENFKIYDVVEGKVMSADVVPTLGSGHGALAGFLKENQVDVLICGGIGGGAQQALAEAGIKLYGGASGNADEAVATLLNGNLQFNPDVHCDHHDHEEGHTCGDHGCGNGSCHS